MATQAERMAAMENNLAAIMAAIQGGTVDSKPAAKDATKTTTAKVAAVKRNLDAIEVAAEGDITFKVVPASGEGRIFHNGARVLPYVDGKVQRSFTAGALAALVDVHDQVADAIDTVDKRAKLGSYKPVKVEAA